MSLELIIGPMFAGKSTELIRRTNLLKFKNKQILVVNHIFNQRYEKGVTTHDHHTLQCSPEYYIETDLLSNVFQHPKYAECDAIIIEELQFFTDAIFILEMIERDHKIVIASGLSGSAEREPMGNISELICHADNITFLTAICKKCDKPGIFSKRVNCMNGTVDIGGNDKYLAVCRYHFLNE